MKSLTTYKISGGITFINRAEGCGGMTSTNRDEGCGEALFVKIVKLIGKTFYSLEKLQSSELQLNYNPDSDIWCKLFDVSWLNNIYLKPLASSLMSW